MRAKEHSSLAPADRQKPLLMVDIDGVLSLFGGWRSGGWQGMDARADERPVDGSFHTIDGILHFLSRAAAAHLLSLVEHFDLVWASGWEEKAEEYLPRLLELPAGLPFLRFERDVGGTESARAHWKLEAIDAYAGERPLAWIDDALNPACHAWAEERPAPTLLVQTEPEHGLTSREVGMLTDWARSLAQPQADARGSCAPEATPRR